MALARIRSGRLEGRDYIKFDYETGHFPRVTRQWSKVPVEVLHYIEKIKHPDFDVNYEVDEITYSEKSKQDKVDAKDETELDKEIDSILETDKAKKEVNYDLNGDGSFDEKDVSIAKKVLKKAKNLKKPKTNKK